MRNYNRRGRNNGGRNPNNRNNTNSNPNSKNGQKNFNPLRSQFDSNGVAGKVRGTAQQIVDKYNALAEEAKSIGERIRAEELMQTAEHYARLIVQYKIDNPVVEKEQPSGTDDSSEENSGDLHPKKNSQNKCNSNKGESNKDNTDKDDKCDNSSDDFEDVGTDEDTHKKPKKAKAKKSLAKKTPTKKSVDGGDAMQDKDIVNAISDDNSE